MTADPYQARRERAAADLEERAARLDDEIDRLDAPLTQSWTHRRAGIKEGQRARAQGLRDVRDYLLGLARRTRENRIPPDLANVLSIEQITALLSPYGKKTKLQALRSAMVRDLIAEQRQRVPEPRESEERRRERLREPFRTRKVPGFFPTPELLALQLVDAAEISPGHVVLEPSAGLGHLLDALTQREPRAILRYAEIAPDLLRVLRELYGREWRQDLYDETNIGSFDRIIMNPPFERGAAGRMVRYCYDRLLRPGGRLVSIIPRGLEMAEDSLSGLFEMTREPVADGAFKGPEAFRQTGVRVELLALEKSV